MNWCCLVAVLARKTNRFSTSREKQCKREYFGDEQEVYHLALLLLLLRGPNGPTEWGHTVLVRRRWALTTTKHGRGHHFFFVHNSRFLSWHAQEYDRIYQVCAKGTSFVPIGLTRPRILLSSSITICEPGYFCMDPNTFFYMCIGTGRMPTSSLVPFRSFPCSLERVETNS